MTQLNTSSTYANIMPKVKLTPTKQKTHKEELKEIIQAPNDPLAKYPLRAFGYSNEVGAAVSAMPVWGKAAETALWIPALMYLGADIYDKYKRGKDGNYSKESASKAVEQAVFQGLASVLLPTAAVKMGQSFAGQAARLDGSGLSASVKEELLHKLEKDFSKAKFAKGDRYESNGVFKTGRQLVWERINDRTFGSQLQNTEGTLQNEGVLKKIGKFFGHSIGYDATVKADRAKVEGYLQRKVHEIFDTQTLIETSSLSEIEASGDKKLISAYKEAMKKADKTYEGLLKSRPNFVVEKILSTNDAKYQDLIKLIGADYPSIDNKINLVSSTDKGKRLSAELIERFMKNPDHKKLVENMAKKAEMSRVVVTKLIESKKMKMGMLKTVGGFLALGFLAVPIDHFVHKYIIKQFLEPSLDGVKNLQSKMSFKKKDETKV